MENEGTKRIVELWKMRSGIGENEKLVCEWEIKGKKVAIVCLVENGELDFELEIKGEIKQNSNIQVINVLK